jgi:two-component system, NarL family, invasion response regulator UvrY
MIEQKKILLVDDHVVIREGLRELIEKLGPYSVVGEYDNGRQLIDALTRTQDYPDLIIMDISMPVMDGQEALSKMESLGMDVPVLMLTLNQDDSRVIPLFRSGARGYLQKTCTADTLRRALIDVFTTGFFHNEFLTISLRNTEKQKKDASDEIADQLTEREKQFLKLVCHEAEYTYDQIAGIMGVQHRTVDGYRESLFEKYGIKSKTGLVLFIMKHNLYDKL